MSGSGNDKATELCARTKAYAIRIVRFAEALPTRALGRLVCNQILRCGTSVASNYRASRRARSTAEFISKLGTVEEECDETLFWLEFSVDSGLVDAARIASLRGEGDEILRIVVASIRSTRQRLARGRAGRSAPTSDTRHPTSDIRSPTSDA